MLKGQRTSRNTFETTANIINLPVMSSHKASTKSPVLSDLDFLRYTPCNEGKCEKNTISFNWNAVMFDWPNVS